MARSHAARPIRYHEQFRQDLRARADWLARHRPPQQLANFERALTGFIGRVSAFPGAAEETAKRGTISYRVRLLAGPLPYLVWYSYDEADADGPVSVLMLLHELQDRERFDVSRFDD